MTKIIRFMGVLAVAAIAVAWLPASTAAENTSISISHISVDGVGCDLWTITAHIDITIDVPDRDAFAEMHYKFIIDGVTLNDYDSSLGTVGPGPATKTELSWPVGSVGLQSFAPHTPIHVVYYDSMSRAYAGFSVDCPSGKVLSRYSSSDQPATGPGPDMVPIPDQAVVGAFVTDTVAYFAPRADAATDIVIEAGKTMWIYGVDESGMFYKVMLSGKFFWVPVETVGPNYDDVWNGWPLPTEIVE